MLRLSSKRFFFYEEDENFMVKKKFVKYFITNFEKRLILERATGDTLQFFVLRCVDFVTIHRREEVTTLHAPSVSKLFQL